MEMIRQNDDRIDGEGMRAPRVSKDRTQRSDMLDLRAQRWPQ